VRVIRKIELGLKSPTEDCVGDTSWQISSLLKEERLPPLRGLPRAARLQETKTERDSPSVDLAEMGTTQGDEMGATQGEETQGRRRERRLMWGMYVGR